jgi:diguanylate cyclase (GGDEF)-like protein
MTTSRRSVSDWRGGFDDGEGFAEVAEVPATPAAPPIVRGTKSAVAPQTFAEIATLRSINARLLREIEVLKRREAHAQQLADRDGLTGLFNRRRLSELLDQAISDAARDRHALGLLFVDLDGFKRVNDHYGHAMGDELLVTIAGRIATRARTGDVVCRYGGDEFVVLLPRVPNRAAALKVASTIRSRVALPCRLDGQDLRVTAAIGVSMYPEDGHTAERLLRRADQLMYRSKASATDLSDAHSLSSAPRRRQDDKSKRHPNG